jgi:hypothetical protein
MNIGPAEAQVALADIESVAGKVKQSSWYRCASTSIILWGFLVAVGYCATQFAPRSWALIWLTVDGIGIVATIALQAYSARTRGQGFNPRLLLAILICIGFGLIWTRLLGRFRARASEAFWPTLFMFGYAIAGLWMGPALVVIGLSITALTVAGYLWIDAWFELYLALVAGGGLMLCGLWMRRA